MEGIDSCDEDGHGRAHVPQGHDGENCAGDRGEVIGIDVGDPPCPHPPDAYISFPGGIWVKGDIKRVEEDSL